MFERIILVTKKTALEELLLRHNSRGQVRFFLERRGASFAEYEAAHAAYRASLEMITGSLPRELPREVLPREFIPNFLFRETDLVIAVGPDGLVVNIAKYLNGQPILAVNPDPLRVDGVLMRFTPDEVADVVRRMREGKFATDRVTLAKATTNDGQTLYAMNDFMIGRRDTISSRYLLTYRGKSERQSSSGILISTGVGSSGWMTSLVTGARAVTGSSGSLQVPFAWDAPYLLFAVREPFPSKYTQATVVLGRIDRTDKFVVTSEMSEGGAIYSDGVPEDAIEFNAGTIATITVAEKSAALVRRDMIISPP